jgi:hypothetical protein
VNEWGFGGEIKSWWDQQIAQHPEWGLSQCVLEQTTEGSRERADLTLLDDTNSAVLVVELRLPDHAHPSPFDIDNLNNAAGKAQKAGARWSATSDGAVFVLADQSLPGSLLSRIRPALTLSRPATRADLDNPALRQKIREGWEGLLVSIAPIVTGQSEAATVAPDELFVESLRALLARPVASVRDGISAKKDQDGAFRDGLIRWMVDQQGWSHTSAKFEEEIGRVASVSAYVFTTRLLFYEALRRAQPSLAPLDLPAGSNPLAAAATVRAMFDEARRVSGDYETVFHFDEVCTYALMTKSAVEGWQRVLAHLGHFELDVIGYDVLGRLFERLIDPHERYQWGQHYTSPDVVDLMLSLAIPDGTGTILDPALGGGTFLVRGYTRKRVLRPDQAHQARLAELAGCDQSAFAASIATVSLASRDLAFADNYPRVKASSFFQRFPTEPFIELPNHPIPGEPPATTPVTLPPLAAVVCNPPYVGYGNIGDERKAEAGAALRRGRASAPRELRQRFNYHLYFWFHSASFLDRTGRLVFITSGEWLDSDYGAQLQNWLLTYCHIELVLESLAETWFTEARVGTVVLCARRLDKGETHHDKDVRFATLRRPLRDLYGCWPGESEADHIAHVDTCRDRLLALAGAAEETDELDWSVVPQADLIALGGR